MPGRLQQGRSTKSYLIIDGRVKYVPLQIPDTKHVAYRSAKAKPYHPSHHVREPIPFSTFMSINILPIESLRVGLNILCFNRFSIGVDASLVYKDQKAQAGETNGSKSLTNLHYDQAYFSLNKNLYILNPYIKYYLYRQKDRPGSGVYLRAGYSLTSLIDGLRSDYYNKEGIPLDTISSSFISMDPANNKVLTASSSFKTQGFTASVGGSFYLGQSHWMMDIGLGYNRLKLPGAVTKSRVVNNETYYYHISPYWRNPLNFPLFFQMSIMYKF